MRRYLRLYRVIGKTFGLWFRPLGRFRASAGAPGDFGDDAGARLHLSTRVTVSSRSTDRSSSSATRVAAPRSCTGCCWGPAIWPRWSCGRCCFPRSLRASCSAASCRGWTSSSPARYHPSDVHDTSLRGIETDDVAWFFRTLDGPFAWAYFLAWQDTWGSELSRREFGIDGVSPREEERFFNYYDACWRRNLTLKGANRILVKSSMLTFRLDALLRRYPDCRLVYVVRDPVEVIPSGMSLLASVLENGYDVWNRTNKEDQRQVAGKPLPGLVRHAALLPRGANRPGASPKATCAWCATRT